MRTVDHFKQMLGGSGSIVEVVRYSPVDECTPSSTDAGLEAAVNVIRHSGIRAATQTIVLFSTGMDSISKPGEVGQMLACQGIRVLAIGLRPGPISFDQPAPERLERRAALRELALRSRGSYYEVDPRHGRLAIRNHVLNAANQLRFGAPIREVMSASLVGSHEVEVEEGSNGLQLLLCHEPDLWDLRISLKRPNGDPCATDERGTESVGRGYHAVSIPSPEAGVWNVSIEMPSGGDPGRHVLTAYSDNPDIHIGLTGTQCLYDVGDQIELRAVVGTPMPVVGLTPLVRVVAPSGKELAPAPESKPLPGGAYVVSFRAEAPGAYEVMIDVRNENQAEPAGQPDHNAKVPTIPAFTRVKRFQVHVRE